LLLFLVAVYTKAQLQHGVWQAIFLGLERLGNWRAFLNFDDATTEDDPKHAPITDHQGSYLVGHQHKKLQALNHGMDITEKDPTTAELFAANPQVVPKSEAVCIKSDVHIYANANPHHP
jgi:hypothetical protein